MMSLFGCCMPKDKNNLVKDRDVMLDDDIKNSNENQDFNAFISKSGNNKDENGQIGINKGIKSLEFKADSFKLQHIKYELNYQNDKPHKTFILDRLKLLHTCNGNKNDFKRELSKTYNNENKVEDKPLQKQETSVRIF